MVSRRILASSAGETRSTYSRSRRIHSSNERSLRPEICQRHVSKRWPRTDEAHVPLHHVPELRQLVERRLPEDPAHARDARIVGQLERGAGRLISVKQERAELLRVALHRAELEERELAPIAADANRAVEDGARGVQLQEDRGDRDDGERGEEDQGAEQDIQRPLSVPLIEGHSAESTTEHGNTRDARREKRRGRGAWPRPHSLPPILGTTGDYLRIVIRCTSSPSCSDQTFTK